MRGGVELNTGFIGAGKVGVSLARYFIEGGLGVSGFCSRSRESAEEAAHFTGTKVFDGIETLVKECDVIFITVPDGSINQIWQQIRNYEIKGKYICHCSGALSSQDAFDGIVYTGAYGYSIHPLFAVSDKFNAYREFEDVFFVAEGDGPNDIIKMLRSLGNPLHIIESQHKTAYHLAAATASNLVCGLIDQSIEIMQMCGFEENEAIRALGPILMGNMAHIADRGPVASLTGPVERNDITTVRKHMDCMTDEKQKEVYRLLSHRLVRMAQRRHPDRDYAGMNEILRKGSEE